MFKKRQIWMTLSLLAITALLLTACQPPVAVPYEEVCSEEYNGKTITTEGVFSMGVSVYCSDTSGEYRCGLNFKESPESNNTFSVDVMVGNRKNMMQELESGFSDADLMIKTTDGSTIGVDDPVTITGRMLVTEGVCVMEVEKIEIPGQ
jgi:hypothetical protein